MLLRGYSATIFFGTELHPDAQNQYLASLCTCTVLYGENPNLFIASHICAQSTFCIRLMELLGIFNIIHKLMHIFICMHIAHTMITIIVCGTVCTTYAV